MAHRPSPSPRRRDPSRGGPVVHDTSCRRGPATYQSREAAAGSISTSTSSSFAISPPNPCNTTVEGDTTDQAYSARSILSAIQHLVLNPRDWLYLNRSLAVIQRYCDSLRLAAVSQRLPCGLIPSKCCLSGISCRTGRLLSGGRPFRMTISPRKRWHH